MTDDFPRIISVDDHVIEPPHVWQTYLPERYRAEGPRVVRSGVSRMGSVGGVYSWDEDPGATPCDFWLRSPALVCERGYNDELDDTGGGSDRLEDVEGTAVCVRDGGRGRTKVGDRVLRARVESCEVCGRAKLAWLTSERKRDGGRPG